MSLTIVERKEVPLLSRAHIKASLNFSGVTPSNSDVKGQLASALKTNQNLIVIRNILTGFGSHTAKISAYVYDNEENLKKIEPRLHSKQAEKLKKAEDKNKPATEAQNS